MLSIIANFPWSLSVFLMGIAAMIIFYKPLCALINRIVEVSGPSGLHV